MGNKNEIKQFNVSQIILYHLLPGVPILLIAMLCASPTWGFGLSMEVVENENDQPNRARGQSNPLAIYEKTKDMTPAQITEYYKQSTDATIQKYGFKVIKNAKERTV